MPYSFRVRFRLEEGTYIRVQSSQWDLTPPGYAHQVVLKQAGSGEQICEDSDLALIGDGFASAEEAEQQGKRFRDALMATLARMSIGAHFGDRMVAPGHITDAGRTWLGATKENPILDDNYGLTVFPSPPMPRFVSIGIEGLVALKSPEPFREWFLKACGNQSCFTDRERVAFGMYSASLGRQPDVRLVTLMMAVECLIDVEERSDVLLEHVCRLERFTKESKELNREQKNSLLGPIARLRSESIMQAGRRLARTELAGQRYMDKNADEFFAYCYDLRSGLVHGREPRSTADEVSQAADSLRSFVRDLLCARVLQQESGP